MQREKTAFFNWQQVWETALNNTNIISQHLPDTIELGGTPACPLARAVEMPPDHEYETGLLSFRIVELQSLGTSRIEADSQQIEIDEDRMRLKFSLGPLTIEGCYALEAKYDPKITMDTAGDLMDLPTSATLPLAAGAEDEASSSVDEMTREEYLNNARRQRERLYQTKNGGTLMAQYDEHNEIYNEAFRGRDDEQSKLLASTLRDNWRAGGITSEMAKDTHEATNDDGNADTPINQASKRYTKADGSQMTYNQNAFTQQLNVAVSTAMQDPSFNLFKPPDNDSKYTKAALTALTFGTTVGDSTGNSKDRITEMKRETVYQSVAEHSGETREATVADLQGALIQGMADGGAEEGSYPGTLVLDEADRLQVRRLIQGFIRAQATAAKMVTQLLWHGRCAAHIHQAEVEIELTGDTETNAPRVHVTKVHVILPAFDFDIDDSSWIGTAGCVARERLAEVYFIRSLLHDQIADRLKDAISTSLAKIFDQVLQA